VGATLGNEPRRAGAGFGGAADEQDRCSPIIVKSIDWRTTTRAHPAYPRCYTPHRSFPLRDLQSSVPSRPAALVPKCACTYRSANLRRRRNFLCSVAHNGLSPDGRHGQRTPNAFISALMYASVYNALLDSA
jgi:hypothetical protein